MLTEENILSKTITFLRFPLIVAVVIIHTNLADVMIGGSLLVNGSDFPVYNVLRHVLTNELARIAVPLFYFISGFLFFYRTEFTKTTYLKKIGKRVRTLMLPYIIWNLMVILLNLIAQTFMPSMISGRNELVVDYSLMDWLNIFWNHKGTGCPICFQFWFIRDLMVVMLLSPVVYILIRYMKLWGIAILGVLWCFDIWFDIISFSSSSFFFFSWGAWFSINKRNFVVNLKSLRIPFTLLYILFVLGATLIWYQEIKGFSFIHHIGIVLGIIVVITWTAHGIRKNILKSNSFLAGSSFFVYAYHGIVIALAVKYWVKFMQPMTELTMVIGYLLMPLLIVVIGVGIYALMLKICPRFTRIITGGR